MVGGRLISYLILWQRRQKNFRRHEKNKNIASATSAGEEAFAWNKIRTHTHVGWAHDDDDNDEHGPDDELGKNFGK